MSDQGAPPPGPPPTPEYLAESQEATIRGVTWMSVIVPLVIVTLRVFTRLQLRKVFGIDDGFIVFAVALLVAYGGVIEASVTKGLGRHVEWVIMEMPQNAIPVALLGQVSQPLVIMACAMGKTSFCCTLLRVGSQTWVRLTVWFILITMNILHVVVSVLLFLRCEDPRVLWDPSVVTTCWPVNIYLYVMYFIGAYSAASDFALAFLPWAIVWHLNMKKKEKVGVAFAMSLGVFACAAAIIKCTHLSANSTSQDPTYDVGTLLLWAGAECALIIIAACVPTLRPILKAIFPSTADNSKSKSSGNSYKLKNFSNNLFTPKSKYPNWSAVVETEVRPDNQSDNNSDRSILQRQEAARTMEPGGDQGFAGAYHHQQPYITKTTSVNVSYGRDSREERHEGGGQWRGDNS